RVFLVILFTSFSGSLVSRIPGAVQQSVYAYTFIVHSGLMNITVDYRRTNRKIDTGKKLKL
ncbi:hypothetical protein AB0W41_23505, partial [Escherichia coli]